MRKPLAGLLAALFSLALVATPASAETVDPDLVLLEDAYADAQAEVERLTVVVATLEAQVEAAAELAAAADAEVAALEVLVEAKTVALADAEADLAAAVAARDALQARFDAFECGNGNGRVPTQCRFDRDGVLVLLHDAEADVVTADEVVVVATEELRDAEAALDVAVEAAAVATGELEAVTAEFERAVIDLDVAVTVRDDAKAALEAYVPPSTDVHPGCKGIAVAQTKAVKGNAPAALATVAAKFGC